MRRSVPLHVVGASRGRPDIVVSGGGIGGLTFALSAHRMGFKVKVYEANAKKQLSMNVGGGIALWPPSQKVMAQLGLLEDLQAKGAPMPPGGYRDANGEVLATMTEHFSTRFPLVCLDRSDLLQTLYDACARAGIQVIENPITSYWSTSSDDLQGICAEVDGRGFVASDILVAADGIHSTIRKKIMTSNGRPPVEPKPCGYAYFRSTVPTSRLMKEGDSLSRLEGFHKHTFEAWGSGNRFGYVPMKKPDVFWFGAIPIGNHGLEAKPGAHIIDDVERQWLSDCFQGWRGPEGVFTMPSLIEASAEILRTDIYKIPRVTKFPWHAESGRVVLLGDSCHATAPNLAQGAGLAIEDAADLAHRLYCARRRSVGPFLRSGDASSKNRTMKVISHSWDVHRLAAVQEYEKVRKKRAWTVQTLADTVAVVGQREGGVATTRDLGMRFLHKWCPSLTKGFFEHGVSYALAGTRNQTAWSPSLASWLHPSIPHSIGEVQYSNIGRLLSSSSSNPAASAATTRAAMDQLPQVGRRFRANPLGGQGKGKVTVSFGSGLLVKALRSVCGLPPAMQNASFEAHVEPLSGPHGAHCQRWTRRFGDNYYYSTTIQLGTQLLEPHSFTKKHLEASPSPAGGLILSEGCGLGWLDKVLGFSYEVVVPSSSCSSSSDAEGRQGVEYRSKGMLVFGYRLPLWKSLTPQSSWVETPYCAKTTEEAVASGNRKNNSKEEGKEVGWTFDGTISMPAKLGGQALMHYRGHFVPDAPSAVKPSFPSAGDKDVESHQASTTDVTKRHVIILGSTGLLGSKLVEVLLCGGDTQVTGLSRTIEVDQDTPVNQRSMLNYIAGANSRFNAALWSDDAKKNVETMVALFEQCPVDQELTVVNLSGENAGAQRWNAKVMQKLQNTRLEVIDTIRLALQEARTTGVRTPNAVLQASAVGIYGNRRTDDPASELTEKDPRYVVSPGRTDEAAEGQAFRISCCQKLEAAIQSAVREVVAVGVPPPSTTSEASGSGQSSKTVLGINLRIGHILSLKGGAFPWIAMAAQAGVSSIGEGQQHFPWIHLDDAAASVAALCVGDNRTKLRAYYAKQLGCPNLSADDQKSSAVKSLGFSQNCFPVNITAPGPLTQKNFFKAIHQDQKRKHLWKLPSLIPVPAKPFAKVFGPSASLFLDSVYSPPTSLIESGAFPHQDFRFVDVESALKSWECSLPIAK